MLAAPAQNWNIFKQIFVEHWDGFTRVYQRYHTRYYDGLVDKMLRCGNPDKIGYIEYRCLHCGQGKHLVAMSCKSSLRLRCAKVYVDNWVSQASQMLHDSELTPCNRNTKLAAALRVFALLTFTVCSTWFVMPRNRHACRRCKRLQG
jgi:transposase-like zinc-binding protein